MVLRRCDAMSRDTVTARYAPQGEVSLGVAREFGCDFEEIFRRAAALGNVGLCKKLLEEGVSGQNAMRLSNRSSSRIDPRILAMISGPKAAINPEE